MANILITWELGGGMGHLARVRPIAIGLQERGHRVVGAFRELAKVEMVFKQGRIDYLQAPTKGRSRADASHAPDSYAQLLRQNAFGEGAEFRALVTAWRTLFNFVRPDLLICDHSPTALVAARGYPFKRALVGTGFLCPPPGPPLPAFGDQPREQTAADERKVLDAVNEVLQGFDAPALDFVGQIYRDVDELALTTFAELDHFGPRGRAAYWGAWPGGVGESGRVEWPQGDGPRVYGYLKPFKALEALLERLSSLRLPTVIMVDGIDSAIQERFASQTLRFLRQPIDASAAAAWCDLAVLNATHGMVSAMLLAGKPTLNIPLHFEQRLTAMNVVQLRAGVAASAHEAEEAIRALDFALANREPLSTGARRFAARYTSYNASDAADRLVQRLCALVE